MAAVSMPSRKKSWQTGRERVSVLAALAIKRDTVSRRLLKIREDNRDPATGEKLTQEDAASRVGVRARTWQRWEAGETVPYPRNLSSIADAFGFDVAEFFDRDPGTVSDTPDIFDASLSERLARIERSIEDARAEREDQAAEIRRLLQEQSELLATIKGLLGMEGEPTLQDRLVQMLRDAQAKAGPGPGPRQPAPQDRS